MDRQKPVKTVPSLVISKKNKFTVSNPGYHKGGVKSDYYRPQRSWGKVMFLQASVILLTGGYLTHPQGQTQPPGTRHPPRPDTPLDQTPPAADSPRADTPPGADPPLASML